MNLVEMRNKASESMSMLERRVVRILDLDGESLGRNGTEVGAVIDDILSEWNEYSELKRQVASVRSVTMVKRLGITFTEADILCRDLSDQIDFLDKVLDKVDAKMFDGEGNPISDPHILICLLKSKIEEFSQMRARIRSAEESCEHDVNVAWYDDDDVQDLMRVNITKKDVPTVRNAKMDEGSSATGNEAAPISERKSFVIVDPSCPICNSPMRNDIEQCFRDEKSNLMITLDRAISAGWVQRNVTPNDMRLHFDRHIERISEIEGR